MIVVTGAAGFIGSQTLLGLNARGCDDILAVGDLSDGKKFTNLSQATFFDYIDYQDFLTMLMEQNACPYKITAVIHQGACSTTTEWDGRYMMKVNYEYTKKLYHYCQQHHIPFIYASSAAVYGGSELFSEQSQQQHPLNVYGYSKWLFDCYMQRLLESQTAQVVGLRYFNVYGPHEAHKGSMASVAYHFTQQLKATNQINLFGEQAGYAAGEQMRDFIYVKDVVDVVLWMLDHPEVSGIYNVGTGRARSFNALAEALIKVHGGGQVNYIPFPDQLKGCYQSYTCADISKLREQGYDASFTELESGILAYYDWLS